MSESECMRDGCDEPRFGFEDYCGDHLPDDLDDEHHVSQDTIDTIERITGADYSQVDESYIEGEN